MRCLFRDNTKQISTLCLQYTCLNVIRGGIYCNHWALLYVKEPRTCHCFVCQRCMDISSDLAKWTSV